MLKEDLYFVVGTAAVTGALAGLHGGASGLLGFGALLLLRALTGELCKFLNAAPKRETFTAGANWMRAAILASLRGYPAAGGDAEIMAEIERIARKGSA